jgi:hypothetical protein
VIERVQKSPGDEPGLLFCLRGKLEVVPRERWDDARMVISRLPKSGVAPSFRPFATPLFGAGP